MSVLSLLPADRKSLFRKESIESVYSSSSRLNLLTKRKRFNPLTVGMSNHSLTTKAGGDKFVTQRVLSAKTHRVKQLQNQLSDAHYHLQELSNENRLLRAIQKKQEIALQRYENSNAELPQVLNAHNEEIRIQQSKHKQLRQQYKDIGLALKERDMQLQQLRDEHQHLLLLSKDRHLLEREKLQAQVSELSAVVTQQNETITMLQRRIALEAKNFKHQLQHEMNKHKDTRHDLDLAICNADKLSTIIEIKEKMLSSVARRTVKSPVKATSAMSIAVPLGGNKTKIYESATSRVNEERLNVDQSILAKLCENSRSISSALSHDEEISSSIESRSRYARSRKNSTSTRSTPNPTRKGSKGSDEVLELAKTVQDGMADLAIFDEEIDVQNSTPEEVKKKIETMKADLLKKIKQNDEPVSRKASALRRKSTEESIEEEVVKDNQSDHPKSRGRRNSNVSFFENENSEETAPTTVNINDFNHVNGDTRTKKDKSVLEIHKQTGKPIDKYCNDIIHDIEKSSNVIDKHVKQFNHTRFESDKLVEQLQAVDKLNAFVNSKGEIPEAALTELNNNFKALTEHAFEAAPTRKRSMSGRQNSRNNLLGDSNMSNQDLLDDLLGKK